MRGSDLTVHHGHISKQGSPYVRWVLGQAAHTAKRHPDFAGGYQAIAERRGSKIATTAVARTLLTRAYHLLAEPPGQTTTDNSMCVARNPAARPQTGRVTNPRASSLQRHETAAALEDLTEQPGPGHTVMGAAPQSDAAPDGCL